MSRDIRSFFGGGANHGTSNALSAVLKAITKTPGKQPAATKSTTTNGIRSSKAETKPAETGTVRRTSPRKKQQRTGLVLLSSDDESDLENPVPRNLQKSFSTSAKTSSKRKAAIVSSSDESDYEVKKIPARSKKVKPSIETEDDFIEIDEEPIAKKTTTKNLRLRSPTKLDTEPKRLSETKAEVKPKRVPAPAPKKNLNSISVADYFGGANARPIRTSVAEKKPDHSNLNGHAEFRRSPKKPVEKEQFSDDDFAEVLVQSDDFLHTSANTKMNGHEKKTPVSNRKSTTAISEISLTPKKATSTEKQNSTSTKKSLNLDTSAAKTPAKSTTANKKSNDETATSATKNTNTPSRQYSYRQYQERGGPLNPGSKPVPKGSENCLSGMSFVITGVLDSIERDTAKELVERHGGKVMNQVSGRTKYVVAGREPGESKMEKAKSLKIKIIDEDGLFDLIRKAPEKAEPATSAKRTPKKSPAKKAQNADISQSIASLTISDPAKNGLPWVDKYKPKASKQVIGQQGEKSCMKKLSNWLKNWPKWHIHGTKEKQKGKGANDDGSIYKAALLSGPPGIGKTTTAHLVCEELALNIIEMNASDQRNKKFLDQHVGECLSSHSITEYGGRKDTKGNENAMTHVLIMDEVDGMSGNEDRAGIAELITLIKKTRIPVICICNDRQSQKIRSLANYCYDLRFHRPQTQHIRGIIMSIAYKENMKLSAPAVDQIVEGAGHDIRQILNHLNWLSTTGKQLDYDEAKAAAKRAHKDESMNIFETARTLLTDDETTRRFTLMDKTELFFSDYDLVPLFVQENYVNVIPHTSKAKTNRGHLELISETADLISWGDMIDRQIRTDQSWTLLSEKAMLSTVMPCEIVKGHLKGQVTFPTWFGQNSKHNKLRRLAQQLRTHMSLQTSSDSTTFATDYAPAIRARTTRPLLSGRADGVQTVVQTLNAYALTREDMSAVLEMGQWSTYEDPMSKVDSKVKSALTRACNKECHKLPYAVINSVTAGRRGKKKASADVDDDEEEKEADEVEEEEYTEF